MDTAAWTALLRRWSDDILNSELAQEMSDLIPPEAQTTRWLGYAGASEAEIAAAEARLGTRLPPSYRSFLAVSNGWRVLTQQIGRLWSTADLGWLRDKAPGFLAIWAADDEDVPDARYFVYGAGQDSQALRTRYLRTALQVSDPRFLDGEFYLLNPQVVRAEGEWEAWFFANWLPGAVRYRSFWELMQGEHHNFLLLRDS